MSMAEIVNRDARLRAIRRVVDEIATEHYAGRSEHWRQCHAEQVHAIGLHAWFTRTPRRRSMIGAEA